MISEDLEKNNEELIVEIFHLVNYVSNWETLAEQITEHIKTEHPTIVQNFFRLIQKIILDYSNYTYPDGRNKSSVDWAKEIINKIQKF